MDMGFLSQLFGQGNMNPGGMAGAMGGMRGAQGSPGALAGGMAAGVQPPGIMSQMMSDPGFQQMLQAKFGQGMPGGDPKMASAQALMGMGQPQQPGGMQGMMQPPQGPSMLGMPRPTPRPGGMGMGGQQGYMAQGGGVQPRQLIGRGR